MGLENITSSYGYLVISDDFYNRNVKDTYAQELYIKCDDSNKLEGQIRQEYDDLIVYNLDEQMQQEQSVLSCNSNFPLWLYNSYFINRNYKYI